MNKFMITEVSQSIGDDEITATKNKNGELEIKSFGDGSPSGVKSLQIKLVSCGYCQFDELMDAMREGKMLEVRILV